MLVIVNIYHARAGLWAILQPDPGPDPGPEPGLTADGPSMAD
jgi:hypothetical protein